MRFALCTSGSHTHLNSSKTSDITHTSRPCPGSSLYKQLMDSHLLWSLANHCVLCRFSELMSSDPYCVTHMSNCFKDTNIETVNWLCLQQSLLNLLHMDPHPASEFLNSNTVCFLYPIVSFTADSLWMDGLIDSGRSHIGGLESQTVYSEFP